MSNALTGSVSNSIDVGLAAVAAASRVGGAAVAAAATATVVTDPQSAGDVSDGTACVGSECMKRAGGLYALNAVGLDGVPVSLSAYRGMAVLVVNVASECGYTDRNYRELQALYDELKTQQFAVLAFPCNQFGQQEPGDSAAINQFVTDRYQVTFPVFEKINVNGPDTHPVYKFLKSSFSGRDIAWNFEKYLVDPTGQPIKHYASGDNPLEQIKTDVLDVLNQFKRP